VRTYNINLPNSETLKIDLSSDFFNDAIIPCIGVQPKKSDLQESYGSSLLFTNNNFVKLFVPRFGEVGEGSIVEVRPQGQWLV